jgi:hypothetical protein
VIDAWWREEARRPAAEKAPWRTEYMEQILRLQQKYLPPA